MKNKPNIEDYEDSDTFPMNYVNDMDKWESDAKVLIEVRGGVVQQAFSNKLVDLIIIDYDNLTEGDKVEEIDYTPVSCREKDIYKVFNEADDMTQSIRRRLKELNF